MTARWIDGFSGEMLRLKRVQRQLGQGLELLRDALPSACENEAALARLNELCELAADGRRLIGERLTDLEAFDRRFVGFSTRLYHAVLDCRMRPFSMGSRDFSEWSRRGAFAREGRPAAIQGEAIPVDRDILEKLKAPLDHLVRNSLDHGIEFPGQRRARGKPDEGTVQLRPVTTPACC